jgi:hypothetical protein
MDLEVRAFEGCTLREIKIRDQLQRVAKFVQLFKGVGDAAVLLNLLHAGIAWAGVCDSVYKLSTLPEMNDTDTFRALAHSWRCWCRLHVN